MARFDGRADDQLRPVSFERDYTEFAAGSVLVTFGKTRVLCTASVDDDIPRWLKGRGRGWVTAEYSLLPGSSPERVTREAAKGKQSGRTQEIQRLIGRALRAVVDRSKMGEVTVTLDCDVLNADGGTRCAAITGAWVALSLAFRHMQRMNVIKTLPLIGQVAAVSCGISAGDAVLDLDYAEDSSADADANFVLTDAGGIVEIQGTAERSAFSEAQFLGMLGLARQGVAALFEAQREAVGGA
jgi:ribonuclease PH